MDFQNVFPMLLHEGVGDALKKRVPELQPCGTKHGAVRGAEHGDPLASLFCDCAIADAMTVAFAEMRDRKDPSLPLSWFGFWYCDDGQYLYRPGDVSLFLECLDRAASLAGVTRGEGRMLNPP